MPFIESPTTLIPQPRSNVIEHNHRIWMQQPFTKMMIDSIKVARVHVVQQAIKQNPLTEVGQTQAVLYLNSARTFDECIEILEQGILKQTE